jgi:hypothetical protein
MGWIFGVRVAACEGATMIVSGNGAGVTSSRISSGSRGSYRSATVRATPSVRHGREPLLVGSVTRP